jgi:hypothetical protein
MVKVVPGFAKLMRNRLEGPSGEGAFDAVSVSGG